MKRIKDYCYYLLYDEKRKEYCCTRLDWLFFSCNNDCVRMGDRKSESIEKAIEENNIERVVTLGRILEHMKDDLQIVSGKEKERYEREIKELEYDILRYKHEVPWLPKYKELPENKRRKDIIAKEN